MVIMKKILILNRSSTVGGIEKSLINFLNYIVKKDCEVDLLIWNEPDLLYDQIPKGVNLLPSPKIELKGKMKSKNPLIRIISCIWYLFYKIEIKMGHGWRVFPKLKKHYDVGISYCQNGYSPYYLIDNTNCDKKIVFYHHGEYIQINKNDKYYYSQFNDVIAVSESVKALLIKEFPDIKNNIKTIYNMANFDEVLELSTQTIDNMDYEGLKILTVARMSEEKGYDYAVDAAKKLEEKGVDFRWYFVGCGSYENVVRKKVEELEVKSIVFLGEIKNPYPYMKKCDLYVQPSKFEAFGLTVQEALLLGKVVVVTDIPTFRNMVLNNNAGPVGIIKSPDDISEGIVELIYNNALKKTLEGNISKLIFSNDESQRRIDELIGF